MTGIYLHLPFCKSFCIYCDFYSQTAADKAESYCKALTREIISRKGFFDGLESPRTLYFGGGTPSLVDPALLESLVGTIRETFSPGGFEEFTLEANPDDINEAKAARWLKMGVNRLSIGVQSFDDGILKRMRRRHTAEGAVKAYRAARSAGFGNVSMDLIFGFEGLGPQAWESTVEKALELAPEHLSCYQMSVEPGSDLGEMARRGLYREPSQEECARQYEFLQESLSRAGYRQYEISNFALPGYESRHNSIYWAHGAYLGLGAAAHSFDGRRTRSWNVSDIDAYAAFPESPSGSETLSDRDLVNERVMLSLRTSEGMAPGDLPPEVAARSGRMLSEGILEMCGGNLRIPRRRLFTSDDIISELFV